MKAILKKRLLAFAAVLISAVIFAPCVFAANNTGFGSSKIATGTTKLINDVLTWIQILAIPFGTLFIIYFQIRKGGADQQDQKDWQKRTNTAIISTVAAEIAATIINLILSYYT
ncbi:hypothetical protein [Ruminococcus sp. Marseille-P6503]|uniref:hypothetical protein n=1 Tax=Ruminococcus sp. Marseille-P6503 TaxID=2364796 RepID=UPI000F545DE0|nr:hypothetical protein [Ruminococcus sp. Marseille-P6503]